MAEEAVQGALSSEPRSLSLALRQEHEWAGSSLDSDVRGPSGVTCLDRSSGPEACYLPRAFRIEAWAHLKGLGRLRPKQPLLVSLYLGADYTFFCYLSELLYFSFMS